MAFMFRAAVLLSVLSTPFVTGQDTTQFWHERYHGLLSMAAYGDFATLCPQTFTQASLLASYPNSTEQPWTLLQTWGPTASGLQGFNVMIPEMDKVIMVFQGMWGWERLNMTPAYIGEGSTLNVGNCANCTAHQGALTAYLEAKEATDDWLVVKQYVNSTGHQWSITGHGFGGMVAQIAAIDLGWRGLSHWSHSHGSPRVFNPAAATLYEKMYEGEASQRSVANNDSVPETIPESDEYTHALSGFHIYGVNETSGSLHGQMNYENCFTSRTDPNCLGGDNVTDHWFYYTEVGTCGSETTYNATAQNDFEASESASYYATATSTFNVSSFFASSTSVSSTSTPVVTVQTTDTVVPTASAAPSTSSTSSAAATTGLIGRSAAGLVAAGLVAASLL